MDRQPRRLRLTANPTVLQRRILRDYFGGRRYTREQYVQLREQYNRELPQIRERFRLRQTNIQRRAARVIQQRVRDRRDRRGGRTYIPTGDNVFEYKQFLRDFKGRTVKVYTFRDGQIIDEVLIDVPPEGFNAWWNNIGSYRFLEGDSGEQTTPLSDGADKVVITPNVELSPNRVEQLFREGIKHCVFQPILEWAEHQLITVKSRTAHFRYKRIVKLVKECIKKYDKGIPEKDLQEICNKLQIGIIIDFPLSKTNFLTFKSLKSPLKIFKFVNTRLNHIDVNEVINKEFIETEPEEFDQMIKQLEESGEYFDYKKNNEGEYIKIRTLKGNFSKKNDFLDQCSRFEIDSGINNCKIDGIQNWELWNFCNEGNKTTGTLQFLDWNSEVAHIDMRRAYSNFHLCKEYEGFVGKITDFRMCNPKDFLNLIGFFRISKIRANSELFNKLNYIKEKQVYPSVELKKWESLGVDIEVDEGCWGTKLDFRFPDYLLEKVDGDPENPRGYSKWCGINEKCSTTQSFQMKGTKEFFENMISHLDEGNTEIKWFKDGEATIYYPKQNSFSAVHIVGFIKMYARLTLINQLLNLDSDKIVGLNVDGIYYKPHNFEIIEPFVEKEGKPIKYPSYTLTNKVGDDDDDEFDIVHYPFTTEPKRDFYKKELFIGAGGNGKTHFNLEDKGLIRPLYVAPSWKLCSAKKRDYKCESDVLSNLLNPKKQLDIYKYYNVLIIDECSQINEDTKKVLFDSYPMCKIIFCGDLGYQLPPTEGEEMNDEGFDKTTEHTTNYRIKCDLQKDICGKVREMIKDKKPKNLINQFICESYPNVEKPEGYTPEDIILCSKTRCIKHQKEDCNCDGQNFCLEYTKKFGKNKWKCTKRNYTHSRGDIVVGEKPELGQWENRHGYTIHSVQGETFDNTIFIDGRNLFDSRMGYTAISRARYHHQIKIII